MRFVSGYIADVDEALALVLHEAGRDDMSQEAVELFLSSVDSTGLQIPGEKVVDTEVRRRYGRNARWQGKLWFVPLPQLRYEALPVPLLMFTIQPYLAVGLAIYNVNRSPSVNLVGPIGKADKLILPLEFIQAILDNRLDSFEIVARDGTHTSRTYHSSGSHYACLMSSWLTSPGIWRRNQCLPGFWASGGMAAA